MSDTEEMQTDQVAAEENPTGKRSSVIKRQKEKLEEKKEADELEEELGGVDDLPDENDEDSDQEYTTKKKKPVKAKPDPIVDPAFQSRLVRRTTVPRWSIDGFTFRTKIKPNDSVICWNKQKSFLISSKTVN